MKWRSLFLLSAALVWTAPAAAAELRTDPAAVLELFTSEGCSSCPPADALLTEIGARKDVIALAYHVDYWNYIGWPDTFGSPTFSNYQRAYRAARGYADVRTPQFMVNGIREINGSRRGALDAALAAAALPIPLSLDQKDGRLVVSASGNTAFPESKLWLVTFKSEASVEIDRGENENRVLDYSHIVTGRHVIGMWDPKDGASVTLPLADLLGTTSDGAVVLIQEYSDGKPGRILGGASFLR